MKKILSLMLILLLFPIVLAVDLRVEKSLDKEILILGLNEKATFDITVTNNGKTDLFSFYTFFESGIEETEDILIESEEIKNVTLTISLRDDTIINPGATNFEYFIQGTDKSEITKKLSVDVLELGDAFTIGSNSIGPDTQTITVFIKNTVDFDFPELNAKFSSPFFNLEKELSLDAYEIKEFDVDINSEDWKKLTAGFYTLKAKLAVEDVRGETEGRIEFLEKELITPIIDKYGFLVVTKVIRKTNEGNTIYDSETTVGKSMISRLFTTFSKTPDQKEKSGGKIMYTWVDKIAPGETIEIRIKTNWLLPFLILGFLIASIYFTRKYSSQKIFIRKKVSFVKANGGEFALKVTIIAEAREFVEKVKIIDRLLPLVKMYERFGGELPDRISKDKRRLEWDFNHLEVGEKRIMSYIVYSKVGILGRFALPGTICRFEQEGKPKQSTSNKAYFLSEQSDRK